LEAPISQQLENVQGLHHIGTHEDLGLFSHDTETYFMTEDGLKYRLPEGEVKMCVTKEDALDWVKRVHEYQIPHLITKEALIQVQQGPYWWPTISSDVRRLIDECTTRQSIGIPGSKINDYGTIIDPKKRTQDWRKPIIQHLSNPMELSNFAFHEELGVLREELPSYFLQNEDLNRRLANGDIKLCISREKGIKWLITMHKQRSPHFSMDELLSQVAHGPYWWPTIPPDADHVCRECASCESVNILKRGVDCTTITVKEGGEQDWRTPYVDYLKTWTINHGGVNHPTTANSNT
jgi:hypothetical protein